MKGAIGDARWSERKLGSEDQPDFLHRTTVRRLSSSPPFPRTRRYRRSIEYVSRSRSSAPKAFLATAFLMLGNDDTWFYDYSGTA